MCDSSQAFGPVSGHIPPSQVAIGKEIGCKSSAGRAATWLPIGACPCLYFCAAYLQSSSFIITVVTAMLMRCNYSFIPFIDDHWCSDFLVCTPRPETLWHILGNTWLLYPKKIPLIPMISAFSRSNHPFCRAGNSAALGLERLAPKSSGCLPLRRNGSGGCHLVRMCWNGAFLGWGCPKWLVYKGTSDQNGWFGVITPISGNLHIES